MAEKRVNYSSGAPLEEKVGYSRMVKVGDHIYVGGTTSVQPDGTVYGENAYEQTRYVLEKQVKLIEQAGAGVGDDFRAFAGLPTVVDVAGGYQLSVFRRSTSFCPGYT